LDASELSKYCDAFLEHTMKEYPDDADGSVLADLAALGIDMTQPMDIEFPVAAPDEEAANAIASALIAAGYDAQVEYDDGEPEEDDDDNEEDDDFVPGWDVYVSTRMVPDYDEIIRIQADLGRIANPLGGMSDGWGVMLDSDMDTEEDE
jgi:Regulator of ribonuclease activity B